MKKMVLALILATGGVFVFANGISEYYPVSGTWSLSGGRLHQTDENARIARVNIPFSQRSDILTYEFNARYEGGAEDGHAGFGIHVFADSAHPREAWGAGRSFLLWLNYDEKPLSSNIPAGFSAQIYRSISNSEMQLIDSVDLNQYFWYTTYEDLNLIWSFKIVIYSNTGEIRVYDPTDPTLYYYVYMDKSYLPLRGDWVILRTNGFKASFAGR